MKSLCWHYPRGNRLVQFNDSQVFGKNGFPSGTPVRIFAVRANICCFHNSNGILSDF